MKIIPRWSVLHGVIYGVHYLGNTGVGVELRGCVHL